MPSILILCTANMVRSPIAEALLWQKLQKEPDSTEWKVESAGTWTISGKPAAQKTIEVMLRLFNIDLSAHRTKLVSRSLIRSFDLVLVMEAGQKEAIRSEFPELSKRVKLLYEMVGQVRDVRDPIGGTTVDFEDTIKEIDNVLSRGLESIVRLARGGKPMEGS